ncbi:MAG: cache domain-containing protein [Deltaproteobacteria bacterium]|nr:cache domain-containing protein [Candidatus Anaeroferrophillus wilburensis]MBN2889375.1 cache domain-containing protein [Deltaproteobacteria bacterium]
MSLKRRILTILILAIVTLISITVLNFYTNQENTTSSVTNLLLGFGTGGILTLSGVYLLHISFRPIHGSMLALRKVMDRVENTSTRAYITSKELAEGAGTQAASLEETAASLEEIKAMTITNAQNAREGRSLMEETQHLIEDSGQSMTQMTTAMDDIYKASGEISRIIKNIDEIAFQTNLLALNAAVEAARAGIHGAGFAVVADEVRNLALRATESAKSTQEMIQNSLTKVKVGVELVNQTENKFKEVISSTSKISELVREIADACTEQHAGLEQVSAAMTQIDAVTQKSAQQAVESSDISSEMQQEAEGLRETVAGLSVVLEGGHLRHEAEKLVKKAMTMVKKRGLKATIQAAQDKNGPLMKGDELYIYIGSTKLVTLLAHPIMPEKLVGPDLSSMADIKGKTFFNDLIEVAETKGAGWVSYWWPKPGEQKPSLKSTFVMKVPGEQAYLGCGIYA